MIVDKAKSILVIGGGGREHAIVQKLLQNPQVTKVYCLPGNAGIAQVAECHNIKSTDIEGILQFVETHSDITLTVVVPDNPLALGLVDRLQDKGHRAFGPTSNAARIEASKAWAKWFMSKYAIPTAKFVVFDDIGQSLDYAKKCQYPTVIKADGLALGKGVVIAHNVQEASQAITQIMCDRVFGTAGNSILIEEFLTGNECSILAFCDGKTVKPMLASKDYKRIHDGDKGANTGGMGAIAPVKFWTQELCDWCTQNIFLPTVRGLENEGTTFVGVIYFGLMVKDGQAKVIEYNARFGDPETQVVLPLLQTDLLDIFDSCIDGTLDKQSVVWSDKACACVVVASGGYPATSDKGKPIQIAGTNDCTIFHASTATKDARLVTNGGRVLNITKVDDSIDKALSSIYKAIQNISFEDMQYRKDIGRGG